MDNFLSKHGLLNSKVSFVVSSCNCCLLRNIKTVGIRENRGRAMILPNFGRSVNPRFIRGAEGTGYTHYITIQFFKLSYGSAHTDTNVKELYRNLSAFALLCSEEIGSELLVR